MSLHMLARMGRMSGFSRPALQEKLQKRGTPQEVEDALQKAFAISEEDLERQKMALANSILGAEPTLEATSGHGIDAHGKDEADRIAESIALNSLGLTDPEKAV